MKIYAGAYCTSSGNKQYYGNIKTTQERLRKEAAAVGLSLSDYGTHLAKQRPRWCPIVAKKFQECANKYGNESPLCSLLMEFVLECKAKKKHS